MEEETAAPAKHPTRAENKPRGVFLRCLVANVLILSAIGAYAYTQREALLKYLTPPAAQDAAMLAEISTLKSRFHALEQQVNAVKEVPDTAIAVPATIPQMPDTAALEGRLATLEAKLAEGADSSVKLQNVNEQVQQLSLLQQTLSQKMQQQSADAPDLRVVAVFQSLRSKALEGATFEDSYQRFLALAQPYSLLVEVAEKLEPYAATGRPTLSEIQRSFSQTLTRYLREKDGADNSLSGKIRQNISEFITVRKLEENGNSTLAMINRAEKAVAAGEIKKAQEELAELPKDITPIFAPWLEEAKAYTEIPALILKLDQRIADILMQPAAANHAP